MRSAQNVADDPTRDRERRSPSLESPQWLLDAFRGDFKAMDEFLDSCGLADAELARLPKLEVELWDKELETVEPFELAEDSLTSQQFPCPSSSMKMSSSKSMPRSLPRPSRSGLLTKAVETPPLAAAGRSPCRAAALRMLEKFPTGQFVLPPGVSLQECFERGPGHLDLFSGSRGLAKQLARSTGRFVLTFDIKHSATEDLLSDEVQRSLTAMVQCGCFSTATAGPVCSSFSRAVRPAVRSAKRPEGLPGITNNMRVKVLQGNAFSGWLAGLIAQCLGLCWSRTLTLATCGGCLSGRSWPAVPAVVSMSLTIAGG